ncbi:MAG: magnesium transporter [Sandaracinaceae bacterium]|jgi:magnesium transporter|nr:magnesium transporter [Sandaracinaceae bacterium]MBK6813115.1 magnesium transporter [Sandaracinaceae bacterium]MBK8412976.1 magnesium transporter [Sandaracinaceae bacterium]MBK8588027.1 magnesium transporter [Sandaracinaceae bacterium]
MRLSSLLGPDLRAVLESDPESLREALADFHAEDIAEILDDLEEGDAIALMRALTPELAASVIERINPELQVMFLRGLTATDAVTVLREMDPDDLVDVLQELEHAERAPLLNELERVDVEAAEEARELVLYGPDTAGGLMTTEFVALPPTTKVWEAIQAVRRAAAEGEVETIYYVYVCGYGNKLLGVVSLRDLILGDPGQELEHLMIEKVVHVGPLDDQEKVADIIARYDLSAVPVVDSGFALLGMVTVDDVVDVVIEEATEDAQMMAGVMPLEDSYFATGLFDFVWKRGVWLVVLFLGQLLTATVMEVNQLTLQRTMELALFIPLIISSGGNVGSQSSTLIIRALAVGEIESRDWMRVVARELAIGLMLGLVLGAMGFLRGYVAGGEAAPFALAIVVSASILGIVSLSAVVGAVLPLIIKRVGLDPAVSSTPFIASVVDVLGLMVYFGVAQYVFSVTS